MELKTKELQQRYNKSRSEYMDDDIYGKRGENDE